MRMCILAFAVYHLSNGGNGNKHSGPWWRRGGWRVWEPLRDSTGRGRSFGKLKSAKSLPSTLKPQNVKIKPILKNKNIEKSQVDTSSAPEDNLLTEKKPWLTTTSNVVPKEEEKIGPLTGQSQINVNKVFISDFNTVPELAYVNLKISSTEKSLEVRVLHDSGCAKSILKTLVFNDCLTQWGRYIIKLLTFSI